MSHSDEQQPQHPDQPLPALIDRLTDHQASSIANRIGITTSHLRRIASNPNNAAQWVQDRIRREIPTTHPSRPRRRRMTAARTTHPTRGT